MKLTFLMIFLSSLCLAGESQLKSLPRRSASQVTSKKIVAQNVKTKQSSALMDALTRIEEQNHKINRELGVYQQNPAVWDYTHQFDFKTGSALVGRLLNSVVSSNLESPILVEIYPDQGLPEGSRFSCMGNSQGKRVQAVCNRLIMIDADLEYEVNVIVLNRDGSSGIKADYFYTGKEQSMTGGFASSVLPLGNLASKATQNSLWGGLGETGNEVSQSMKSETQGKESKAYIKAGKEVIVYFRERFKL